MILIYLICIIMLRFHIDNLTIVGIGKQNGKQLSALRGKVIR